MDRNSDQLPENRPVCRPMYGPRRQFAQFCIWRAKQCLTAITARHWRSATPGAKPRQQSLKKRRAWTFQRGASLGQRTSARDGARTPGKV